MSTYDHTQAKAALDALKEALLGRYEVRKTAAQKSAFIDWAKEYAAQCGMEMTVEESGKIVRTRNLIVGNPDTAKTLITAHYDTCARLPFPNFMTPACWPVIILTQIVLPMLIIVPLTGAMGYGMGKLCAALNLSGLLTVLLTELLLFGIVFGMIWLMLAGPENPHTANDNTSGTAMVLLAMRLLGAREDVAYVFFDNEEKGLLGSSAFVKKHPAQQKNAFVLNLDCVSDGGTMLYACSKHAWKLPQAKAVAAALEETAPAYGLKPMSAPSPKVLYPSDQMAFARGTAFASLKGKRILYLDRIHTKHDTVFEDRNLLCLMEVIARALIGQAS